MPLRGEAAGEAAWAVVPMVPQNPLMRPEERCSIEQVIPVRPWRPAALDIDEGFTAMESGGAPEEGQAPAEDAGDCPSQTRMTAAAAAGGGPNDLGAMAAAAAVSYKHLPLPTNREV